MAALALAGLSSVTAGDGCIPSLNRPFLAKGQLTVDIPHPANPVDRLHMVYSTEVLVGDEAAVYRLESPYAVEGFFVSLAKDRPPRYWLRLKSDVRDVTALYGWGKSERTLQGQAMGFLPYLALVHEVPEDGQTWHHGPLWSRWDTRIRAAADGFYFVVWRCDASEVATLQEQYVQPVEGEPFLFRRTDYDRHDLNVIPLRIEQTYHWASLAGGRIVWEAFDIRLGDGLPSPSSYVNDRLKEVDELPLGARYAARIGRILLPGENPRDVIPREVDRRAENLANLLAGGQSRELRRAVTTPNTTANRHRRWQWMLGGVGIAILLAGLWLMARKG